MIGQKTLHSFFSAAPAKKRGRSPEAGGDAEVATEAGGAAAALEGAGGGLAGGGLAAVEGGVSRLWRGAGWRGVSRRWRPLGGWGDHAPRRRFQKPRAPSTPD